MLRFFTVWRLSPFGNTPPKILEIHVHLLEREAYCEGVPPRIAGKVTREAFTTERGNVGLICSKSQLYSVKRWRSPTRKQGGAT